MSLRILVLSDTHRSRDAMRSALPLMRALSPHKIIHLGDCEADAAFLKEQLGIEMECVRGNCDFVGNAPEEAILEAEGARLFLTHGHRYGVKAGLEYLLKAVRARDCGVALFGHTHRPLIERQGGILLVNPGSLAQPRGAAAGSMALLMIEGERVEASLLSP